MQLWKVENLLKHTRYSFFAPFGPLWIIPINQLIDQLSLDYTNYLFEYIYRVENGRENWSSTPSSTRDPLPRLTCRSSDLILTPTQWRIVNICVILNHGNRERVSHKDFDNLSFFLISKKTNYQGLNLRHKRDKIA